MPRSSRRTTGRRARCDGCAARVRPAPEGLALRLALRPPYDLDGVLRFLGARALPGVERVDGDGYARTVALDSGPAVVRVGRPPAAGDRATGTGTLDALELRVTGAPATALLRLTPTRGACSTWPPTRPGSPSAFGADPLLGPLVRRRPGLRIAGAWDPFECAVRAVLGQQVSVEAARTLAVRLVARAGARLPAPLQGLTHLFPSPAAIASADLAGLGLTSARAASIAALARAVADGRLDLRGAAEDVIAGLRALPGFGDWTAQYVALRALGEPDAFPSGDLVLRRVAGGASPLSARALAARAEAWRPWRGYAVFHLWAEASSARDERGRRRARPLTEPDMRYDEIETPIGPLLAVADDEGLRRIFFPDRKGRAHEPEAGWVRDPRPFRDLREQLARVLRRPATHVLAEARAGGHRLPAGHVARARRDPLRRDGLVRRDRAPHRAAGRVARGRRGERGEPAADRRALPPRHRRRRLAHRLWRRAPDQARAPRARGRGLRRAAGADAAGVSRDGGGAARRRRRPPASRYFVSLAAAPGSAGAGATDAPGSAAAGATDAGRRATGAARTPANRSSSERDA